MSATDLFISYHPDDAWGPDEEQWVHGFRNHLQTQVSKRLGRRVQAWRTEQFPDCGSPPDPNVDEQLNQTRIFVAVLSPLYVSSTACLRELQLFLRNASFVRRYPSLIAVVKTPIRELREEPRPFKLFTFYQQELIDAPDEITEFHAKGRDDSVAVKAYWRHIDIVARVITDLLTESSSHTALVRDPSLSVAPALPVESRRESSLFLCYRREDTQDAAGRLHDRLVQAYGTAHVFMDIDSVPLGIDFVDHVSEHIARCHAVVVLIGKQWLKIRDKRRRRRLDNDDDLVRAEIAAALQQKVPVIPVLVQDAEMPSAEELPANNLFSSIRLWSWVCRTHRPGRGESGCRSHAR